eukprot:5108649-Alexandrium_andersonii.AAC.1
MIFVVQWVRQHVDVCPAAPALLAAGEALLRNQSLLDDSPSVLPSAAFQDGRSAKRLGRTRYLFKRGW